MIKDLIQAAADYVDCMIECFSMNWTCISQCNRQYRIAIFKLLYFSLNLKFIQQNNSQQVNDCPCSAGCPNGCPCPVYECPLTTTSVLILNTYKSYNVPLLTDINGNVQTINFKIENDVYVDRSCGVQFKGDFYVYGSYLGDKRQIAKVTNCSLKRIGTLPFTHFIGACAATNDQVFLCFDYNSDKKTCRAANEPTGNFNRIAKSTNEHSETRIAANDGKLLCLIEKLTRLRCIIGMRKLCRKQ